MSFELLSIFGSRFLFGRERSIFFPIYLCNHVFNKLQLYIVIYDAKYRTSYHHVLFSLKAKTLYSYSYIIEKWNQFHWCNISTIVIYAELVYSMFHVAILKRHQSKQHANFCEINCASPFQATRYTCNFSVNPWVPHSTILDSNIFLHFIFCLLFAFRFSCMVFTALNIISPFWHSITLSSTNHQSDKKDEISSIIPKLPRWWRKQIAKLHYRTTNDNGQSIYRSIQFYCNAMVVYDLFNIPLIFCLFSITLFWIRFSNLRINL